MKTIILLFSIAILVAYPILEVKATNYTESPCDHTQLSECTTQNFIIEKQDKQIANLTGVVIGLKNSEDTNITLKNIGVIFGIIGSIVGITGGIYGIKKKRQVSNSQLKTEKTKRSAYRSTKQAKDAEKTRHNAETVKTFWDLFRGK